jgi:hypothetical protein
MGKRSPRELVGKRIARSRSPERLHAPFLRVWDSLGNSFSIIGMSSSRKNLSSFRRDPISSVSTNSSRLVSTKRGQRGGRCHSVTNWGSGLHLAALILVLSPLITYS